MFFPNLAIRGNCKIDALKTLKENETDLGQLLQLLFHVARV